MVFLFYTVVKKDFPTRLDAMSDATNPSGMIVSSTINTFLKSNFTGYAMVSVTIKKPNCCCAKTNIIPIKRPIIPPKMHSSVP